MNKTKLTLSLSLITLFLPFIALAHNPRLVESGGIVNVQNPEVSQAFYGQLKNTYQDFKIDSAKPFNLYTNILVPDKAGAQTALLAQVIALKESGREVIGVMDGTQFDWTTMYEPFGGDYYKQGPAYSASLPAGQYLIQVSSHDLNEKYVLVVGQKEGFGPGEVWNTLKTLPTLKKDFFNKSPWTAYFNYIGLMLLVAVLVLVIIICLIYWLLKRRNK